MGGARHTHASKLAADLDYIVVESISAQHELAAGRFTAEGAAARARAFLKEVETLARSGALHLQAMGA